MKHFINYVIRHLTPKSRASALPVHAFCLIRHDKSSHAKTGGNWNLKGITFCLVCNRANNRQPDLVIVGVSGHDKRRTMPCLFVTDLRTQINVDDIAAFGCIGHKNYKSSLPTGGPKSILSGRFSSVTRAIRSSNRYLERRGGLVGISSCRCSAVIPSNSSSII